MLGVEIDLFLALAAAPARLAFGKVSYAKDM
jgi:hypothetical protein